jgi:hypothetical protein
MSIQGVHPLVARFVLPIRSLAHGGLRLFGALALLLVGAVCAPIAQDASAKAPPLATTVLNAEALATPDYDAARVAVVPQGAEVELTGEAAPGFLGVYYDGQVVWVPAQYLSLGVRPGIDTAVIAADTPLLEAPMREAAALEIILEGEAVILTGATIDGYDAAAYDGAGGWIDERDLVR